MERTPNSLLPHHSLKGDPARIFLSYSRADAESDAKRLRLFLIAQGFSVWQDIVALEGGRDWWTQIEGAIRSPNLDHFLLVVTPGAIGSKIIRRELRLARQEGKTISPVRGPGIDDLKDVPRWLGQIYDLDLPDHVNRLLATLAAPGFRTRVLMMAPEPPVDFVPRPREYEPLKRKLLDGDGDSVAISAAVKGAGGYGKTTLAMALAHDPDIQDAYFDGVLWVELGEQPKDLIDIVSDLVTRLTASPPGLATIGAASSALGEALGHRRILMIIDDVWRSQDLHPFLHGGPKTTRLITTRLSRVLPTGAFRQSVDEMARREACALLSQGLPRSELPEVAEQLDGLAARLGDWPQLLKLANGFLRERIVESGDLLHSALSDAEARLDHYGLTAFDAEDEADRLKAVALTVQLSLGLLSAQEQASFSDLAIFPEDSEIPVDLVTRYWQSEGRPAHGAKDLLVKLNSLSLLLDLDLARGVFRLHDTIRHYLIRSLDKTDLADRSRKLLAEIVGADGSSGPDDAVRNYSFQFLLFHFAAAEQSDRIDQLLLDPRWMAAKLEATGRPETLLADYDRYARAPARELIGRTLRLIMGILVRDPGQLLAQLISRLMDTDLDEIEQFTAAARLLLNRPAILAQRATLTQAGAEVRRLDTHSRWVATICLLPDGRIASGSGDGSVRLWDLGTGLETDRLAGHEAPVSAMCPTSGGCFVTGGLDGRVRVWDCETNEEVAGLSLAGAPATALCRLPDGRLSVGAMDGTIRIWDTAKAAAELNVHRLASPVIALCACPEGGVFAALLDGALLALGPDGEEQRRFIGHDGPINALSLVPGGRLASGSDDATVRIWNCADGGEIACFHGHSFPVTALAPLADNRLASGSWDDFIVVRDLSTGEEVIRIDGHSGTVSALCVSRKGQLVSGSWDETIRVWDVDSPPRPDPVDRHGDNVTALCVLTDGTLASGSGDATIRLWDVDAGNEIGRIADQRGWVTAMAALADGRFAAATWDNRIRLWDTRGSEKRFIGGHEGRITGLCALSPPGLASCSLDGTIAIWDVARGVLLRQFEAGGGAVHSVCFLGGDRIASASDDGVVRVWDAARATCLLELSGHGGVVSAVCRASNDALMSASCDGTIRLWDWTTGEERNRFDSGTSEVTAILVVGERIVSTARDNSIRLWELATGRQLTCLNVDAPVQSLAVISESRIIAGDDLGRLHWLEILI